MTIKSIKNINISGKRVLLRIDINSEIINGKVQNNPRFLEHSKTIKFLKGKKAKIIILAHQGNPGEKDFTSLRLHSKILNKYTKVNFIDNIIGKKAINSIRKLKNGEALLLENVRFLKEEFNLSSNNMFVNIISKEVDIFVQDAFSICHRNQTSIVLFPKVLPSYIGLVMENELKNIDKIKDKTKNALFILGGTKTKDLIPLLKNKRILSGGILSLLTLNVKGIKLGKEDELLKKELELINKIKPYLNNIITPIDFAVKVNGKRKELSLNELPTKYQILDIGKETINYYKQEINKSSAIFFKGAVGNTEDKGFELGTRELLKIISKSKKFSLIAGGSSATTIDRFKINKKGFSYISLSGGALVHYLAGEKLPGLDALVKGR